jgi:hypothetical protein
MIRSFSLALAVAALAFATDAAFAGGRSGGSSKSNNQYVRIKNIGSQPVLVNAKTGAATGAAGAKTVNQNGVAQFTTKKVASQAWAANTAQTVTKTLDYTFPGSQYVYLTAETDNSTTSLTFSPPGKIF